METQYFKDYSPALGRDMECKVYGHGGRPVLFIPCQDGRFFDFENFRMTDAWAPWIESGQVMVFSIDTMDAESWSNKWDDPYWRIRRYEQWLAYITQAPMFHAHIGHLGEYYCRVVIRESRKLLVQRTGAA